MEIFLYLLAKTVAISLDIASLAMLARMLMPIFVDVQENRVYVLSCLVSEPFIAPIRFLLGKFKIGDGAPIDLSFFATYLIIWLIRILLPAI